MYLACCGFYLNCIQLGRCVAREYGYEGEYVGHKKVHECSYGIAIFVNKNETHLQKFLEIAEKHPPRVFQNFLKDAEHDQKLFDIGALQRPININSANDGSLKFYENIGMRVREGGFWVKNLKVIEVKDCYQLVSWMYKDKVHYGISLLAENGETYMMEFYRPTATMNGNSLRAWVIEKFHSVDLHNVRLENELRITLDVNEIQVGHVFIYEPTKTTRVFAKVLEVGEHIITTRSYSGLEQSWRKKAMPERLMSSVIIVTTLDQLPESLAHVKERLESYQ